MALASFMRLSLLKVAHAVLSGAAYRKSGSPVLFGPGTLWRTWGTRPVPNGAVMRLTPAGSGSRSSLPLEGSNRSTWMDSPNTQVSQSVDLLSISPWGHQ